MILGGGNIYAFGIDILDILMIGLGRLIFIAW